MFLRNEWGTLIWAVKRQPSLVGYGRSPNGEVLLGSGQSGVRSGVANDAVGVKLPLPVVRVVAVRTNREHGTGEGEGKDLDVRRGVGEDIGDLCQIRLEQRDDLVHVGSVVELRLQINTAERVVAEVLDDLSENLAVADDIADVVKGIDGGNEQSDFFDRAHDASGDDEVARFEGLQDDEEDASSEVGKQAAPGNADGHAGGGDEGCKAGGLHAKEAED